MSRPALWQASVRLNEFAPLADDIVAGCCATTISERLCSAAITAPATDWMSCWRSRTGRLVSPIRSEEHTSELQSLMRISYAVFCLKKKNKYKDRRNTTRY